MGTVGLLALAANVGSTLLIVSAFAPVGPTRLREEASQAPAVGAPVHGAPAAHSVTHAAPSCSAVVEGNNVVATSALASGSGT